MNYFIARDVHGRMTGLHLDYEEARAANRFSGGVLTGSVPDDWEMFTARGNKRITALAGTLVKDLAVQTRKDLVLDHFVKSFRSLYGTKTMAEAADTAVREAVWGFLKRFTGLYPRGEETLNRSWDEYGCD